MIIFEDISWRNFLSTGQQPTTINFNKNKTTLKYKCKNIKKLKGIDKSIIVLKIMKK